MRKIVRRPARKQLTQRDAAELRMLACLLEIGGRQAHGIERLEVPAAQLPELADERGRGPSVVAQEPAFAIKWREPATAGTDLLDARHPVGDLAIREMRQHFDAVPRARAIAKRERVFGGAGDQRFNRARRLTQHVVHLFDHDHSAFRASIGSIRVTGLAAAAADTTPTASNVAETRTTGAAAKRSTPNSTAPSAGSEASATAAPAMSPRMTGLTASTRTLRRFSVRPAPSAARIASSRARRVTLNAVTA